MYKFNYQKYILITLLISGCYVSEDIKTKNEFDKKSQTTSKFSILTKDSTKYFLHHPTLIDSIIKGKGWMEKGDVSEDFEGEIKLSDVLYIQADDASFWKSVAAIGVIGFLGYSAAAVFNNDKDGVGLNIVYPSSGGGGSCPFVYSRINSGYILEGEAIPMSLGKKLETETTNSLTHLTSGEKEISLMISNERPETHYINSVRLLKYDYKPGYKLLADENNLVWPAADEKAPVDAEDMNKHNILPQIETGDGHYWESDLSTAVTSREFTDRLVVTFPKEKQRSSASLIVKAINTRISDVLFRKVYDFLGDEILDFVNSAEHDPLVLSSLKSWMNEVSLKAFVWNKNKWEYAGLICAEATTVPFERLIRLDLKDIKTDDLTIKLEFMTDVWKIDRVSISFTETGSLEPAEIPITSADFSGSEVKNKLSVKDEVYQVLLPGDKIELKYYDNESTQNSHYFLNVSGYIYEWYVKNPDASSDLLAFIPQGRSRMDLFRTILNNKNLLLPPVYDEWRKVR